MIFLGEKIERRKYIQIHAQPHTETDKTKCMTGKLAPKRIRQFYQQRPLQQQQQIDESTKTITRLTLKDFFLLAWLSPEGDKEEVAEEQKVRTWGMGSE